MDTNNDFSYIIKHTPDVDLNYFESEGFVFQALHDPKLRDAIVIHNPQDSLCFSPRFKHGTKTLDECIKFINDNSLEKAIIVGNDISFITRCPSLKHLAIHPSLFCENGFDFSPLYKMNEINSLRCVTKYGEHDKFQSEVDYSKIKGLKQLYISGKGHLNYHDIDTLEELDISNVDISNLECFNLPNLKSLRVVQCKCKSLSGIEKMNHLQRIELCYLHSLSDISALKSLTSIRYLRIKACSKIKNLDVLSNLTKIEFLFLSGKNEIPNLAFLSNIDSLKHFSFDINVLDGNLDWCKTIKNVVLLHKKRHYNLSDKSLPKDKSVRPLDFVLN